MSSVANNHSSFGQPSLKASPTSSVPMPFYNKRDSAGSLTPDCYPLESGPGMRSRQSEYSTWSSLNQMNAPHWNELNCDPNTPHVGSLPAAQSLLSHPPKNCVATTSTTTVITNQNGKNFTAPTSTTFQGYDDHQQQYPPSSYTLKRNATYSGPRPAYLNNPPPSSMTHMDYADGHPDLYHAKSTSAFHHLTPDTQFNSYRYGSNPGREDKAHLPTNGGLPVRGTTITTASPPQSVHSSDGETTASSTRGASSLPSTGALSMTTSGGVGANSLVSQTRRQRKPAPTLATGRRNLKNEQVDQEEAERRMKRRERNRKSAQKCRERKMHRTNELQAQVAQLKEEVDKLLRQVNMWRSTCRQYVDIIRTQCPDYRFQMPTCLTDSPESYLSSANAGNLISMDVDGMQFSGVLDQSEVNFYNRPPEGDNYGTLATGENSSNVPGAPASNIESWNGSRFSQPINQLPPVSQFVPLPEHMSPNATSLVLKTEPSTGPGFWNGDEPQMLTESQDTEWKAENDTDSPPSRLNTPTTNDADKTSTLSSSL
ncbi:unnamed protein product [Hymenolepis diminuta]|uniref:BZIP domain-containing protein n=1 Tax=Hymenolepis diminuta TaxID=6216 RepID=A0A0R3SCC3_HYMDI|nr:unnamed protein product [Hymenolepis diminuta]VUZ55784.1 unnamed protein product [Hymenolepis diminuta]